ncbi:MAG: sigma-70 family RNA polymerase sigma factor [Patescibacteria group bacterium]|nr:sigma-70 family RNA polymerase sigma factor [Patescibacteria group bacterium]
MELQSYVKQFTGAEKMSGNEYQRLFAIIRNVKASEKERGAAATLIAASCYLQIAKIVWKYRYVDVDLVDVFCHAMAFLAELCLASNGYDPAFRHIWPYAHRAVAGEIAKYVRCSRSLYSTTDRAAKKVDPVRQAQDAVRLNDTLHGDCRQAEELIAGYGIDPEATLIAREECSLEERYERMLVDINIALDELAEEIKGQANAERNLRLLKLRLGFEGSYSLDEIGKSYGVSRERVRQIEMRLMKRLSHLTGIPVEQLRAIAELLAHETGATRSRTSDSRRLAKAA